MNIDFFKNAFNGLQDWYDNVKSIDQKGHRYKFDADEVSPEQAQWVIDNFNDVGMNANNTTLTMTGIDPSIIPSDTAYRDYNNEVFLYHENDEGQPFIGRAVEMDLEILNSDLQENPSSLTFVQPEKRGFTYGVFEYQGQAYATKNFNVESDGDLINTRFSPESGVYRIAPVGHEQPVNTFVITKEHIDYIETRLQETGQPVPDVIAQNLVEEPQTEAELDNAANPQFIVEP